MQVLEHLKSTSQDRFRTIYESLQRDGYGPLDGEIAKQLHYRPFAIKKLPMEQRAKRAKSMIENAKNRELAYEILGAYLIAKHHALVTTFLDLTGVKHEKGMIDNVVNNQPDPAKIPGAIAELDQAHPPEDVTLYLAICAEQWPSISLFDELWRKRKG